MYPQSTYMDFNISSVLKLVSEASGMLVGLCSSDDSGVTDIHENSPDSSETSLSSDSYLAKNGFKVINPQVKSGATCMLDGLGADEIFCGYQRYRASYLRGGFASMINEMKFGREKCWALLM
jgi:hypothetical protein